MPRIAETEFCVLDFETDGRSASRGGRGVEIGAVRIDASGRELGRYVSLLRGDGRPGPTRVHGITSRHLRDAPRFEEVVGDLLSLLDGAVVVAHNVSFDAGFLRKECQRAGVVVGDFRRLCTVRLARRSFPGPRSYSLGRITRDLGIPLEHAHTALADAVATSRLLAACLQAQNERGEEDLVGLGCRGRVVRWPQRRTLRRSWTREQAEAGDEPGYAEGSLFAGLDESPQEDETGNEAAGVCSAAPPAGAGTSNAPLRLLETSSDAAMYVRLIDRLLTGEADVPTMRASLAGFSTIVELSAAQRAAIHRDYLAGLSGSARSRGEAVLSLEA